MAPFCYSFVILYNANESEIFCTPKYYDFFRLVRNIHVIFLVQIKMGLCRIKNYLPGHHFLLLFLARKVKNKSFFTRSNTKKIDKNTTRSEVFWRTLRCLIWWWNTLSNVWYYFSNKTIFDREIKDAKPSSFSSDIQTLIKH